MAYIYLITNNVNEKVYVGKTSNTVEQRWWEHVRESKSARSSERALYRAFNKYGIENFKIETLEECSSQEAFEKEKYWIAQYDSYHNGYNETLGGDGKLLYDIPRETLYNDLFKLKLTRKQIAEKYDCCIETISRLCNDYKFENLDAIKEQPFRKEVATKTYDGVEHRFVSQAEAARWLISLGKATGNVTSTAANIGRCCQGKRKTCCGLSWYYCDYCD